MTSNKNNNSPEPTLGTFWKWFGRVIIALFIGIFGLFFILPDSRSDYVLTFSNREIVDRMTENFNEYDTVFYKPIGEILGNIPYEGFMKYWLYSSPGSGEHELVGCHDEMDDDHSLNDTFPWVEPAMKEIVEAKHFSYIPIFYGQVYIKPQGMTIPIWNCYKEHVKFIYSTMTNEELLNIYRDYLLLDINDTISDDYKGNWLKRIEKNWYIKSDSTDLLLRDIKSRYEYYKQQKQNSR